MSRRYQDDSKSCIPIVRSRRFAVDMRTTFASFAHRGAAENRVLQNRGAHVEQARTSITSQFVARFSPILNPPRNLLRVAARDGVVSFSLVGTWHEISVRAQRLKLQNFPTFTAFEKNPPRDDR
jgi:hypothetical protein